MSDKFKAKYREIQETRLKRELEDYGFTVIWTNGYVYNIVKNNTMISFIDQGFRILVTTKTIEDGNIDFDLLSVIECKHIEMKDDECQCRNSLIDKLLRSIY